ncbi:hypothetical protein QTI24_28840 [Variovorax sp. J22P240]|uniref:hypothetical protein n=1 Tax=Variovorax sp. J22P240 TaxID=3053514 RepID=UPI0025786FAC|nr:hypothetical protein [Variovorax sp. J22P240]MDM0002639.1 hypothetical protein [Variovorax sp. J22P240]
MPSSTIALARIDQLSHRAAAAVEGLPKRWQDALSDGLARLTHPRHDDLRQLNEHALRDIGLSGCEFASVEVELCDLAGPMCRARPL